jgi:hypothetical protein
MPSTLLRIFRYSTAQYTYQEDVGYILPSSQAEEWLHLDRQLTRAQSSLKVHYRSFPALGPSNPWAFGYLRPHSKRGILAFALEKSRQWFGVWFGLLSYIIAKSISEEMLLVKDRVLAEQKWREVLIANCGDVQIDAAWIDLLLDTGVASFSPRVWRTGTFVYITPGNPSQREAQFQPDVEWFVGFGVPVWYRWDKEAVSLPANQYLAPLEYQLQQADSFMRKSPSPLPAPYDTSVVAPVDDPITSTADDALTSTVDDPPTSTVKMDAFLKLREERTARLIAQETPEHRALRRSRENQPPTVNARVFEWTPNANGEFVREEIMTKPRRREVLNEYKGNQRQYNAVLNEWHLCILWEHFEESDDEDEYFPYIFEGVEDPPDRPTNVCSYGHDALSDDVWIPALRTQENRLALRLQEEILHVAFLYFGYTALVPLRDLKTPILKDEQQQKKFCREFGLIWDQVAPVREVLEYPAVAAVIDFYQRLAKNDKISPDEWDLYDENRQSLLRSPRFKLFRRVSSKQKESVNGKELPPYTLYMLELGSKAITSWRLAVKKASDALVICRLDPQFNEHDIVEFLLTNGIGFHTLQSPRTLVRTPDIPRPDLTPLTRSENYVFGSRDYLTYREHCHSILNHPRGRAALMHGHFMWRIAFRSVMRESVLSGPSGWSTDIDEMIVVQDPSTNTEFVDDKLSTAEQDALCGTYRCLTGEFLFSMLIDLLLIFF